MLVIVGLKLLFCEAFYLVRLGIVAVTLHMQRLLAKVDQHTIWMLCDAKIGEQLIAEIRYDTLRCFQFHHHITIAEEVQLIMLLKGVTFILNRYMYLTLERDASVLQFIHQGLLVHGFFQSWPQFLMNLHTSPDDVVKFFFIVHARIVVNIFNDYFRYSPRNMEDLF